MNDRQFATCESKDEFVRAVSDKFMRASSIRKSHRRRAGLPDNPVVLTFDELASQLVLTFECQSVCQSITIPLPYLDESGCLVIGNRVRRAVGTWYLVDQTAGLPSGQEITFWGLMEFILIGRIEEHLSFPGVSKKTQTDKILSSFSYKTAPATVRRTQGIINALLNDLPICGTPLQTWAMNNRVVFIDPSFDSLPPKDALEYQRQKNELFFPWTSLGLSDSSATKNYLLKQDLRKLTPFGVYHHNPMRNLYQSLGMEGEELPKIQTASMASLCEQGCARRGFNLMTAFLDLGLTFEDQVIVGSHLMDKVHTKSKSFICFGTPAVSVGDSVAYGAVLSNEPANNVLCYNVHGDSAEVTAVEQEEVVFDGTRRNIWRIDVDTKRTLKDGSKFTNRHGNKGVAVFADTGVMFDEGAQKERRIDIIVSGKTIKSRRNFGQVIEALLTLSIGPEVSKTLSDASKVNVEDIKARLASLGYKEDGTSKVKTQWGEFDTICGWVFWGLIKDPEDGLWVKRDVRKRDSIGVRTSGVKLSHVELRGLVTNFGPQSAIIREVFSWQEGAELVEEYLRIVRSMRGELPEGLPTIRPSDVLAVNQEDSFFHRKGDFSGTLCEEDCFKDGAILELPLYFVTKVPKDRAKPIVELVSYDNQPDPHFEGEIYSTNRLYIPFFELRAPWQHQTGLWGISDFAGLLNNILISLSKLEADNGLGDCCRTLRSYFSTATQKLTTKRGALAVHGMSVRYPNAAKATAALSDTLPDNTVQIPRQMADDLEVRDGEFVLVERFPCLGFMSLRVQRVVVSDDPKEQYVVKVSGNSLNSLDLDFDGDVLFLMSFKSLKANDELELAFRYPKPAVANFIHRSRQKKQPKVRALNLDEVASWSVNNGEPALTFKELVPSVSAKIAQALIGIKTGTGSSVALGYNLLRIVEGAYGFKNTELLAGSEEVLNIVANSVFAQKHIAAAVLEA